MPCYHPLKAYYSRSVNEKGKRNIVFSSKEGYSDMPVELPCGRCIGCRIERARQWAVRCMHESKLHDRNCFLTLTYSDEHLPYDCGIHKRDMQLFLKRLRKSVDVKVRYFLCGEYGDQLSRPHYHLLLFGYRPDDVKLHSESDGIRIYTSASISDIWDKGHHIIGDVTYQSARYVASYINKRVTGDLAEEHYRSVNLETGEVYDRSPEFVMMSLKPGIGRGWYERYKSDYYRNDYLIIDGKKQKPPKYYDNQLKISDPDWFERIKADRIKAVSEKPEERTYLRLEVKEFVANNKLQLFKRESL